METFISAVDWNPPWFGSNQKYSSPMTVWGPMWKESVVSVTASKPTRIWHMYPQRPVHPPAEPRYAGRTAPDSWLKSDLRPSKASLHQACCSSTSTCVKSSENKNGYIQASASICFHASCLKQGLIITTPSLIFSFDSPNCLQPWYLEQKCQGWNVHSIRRWLLTDLHNSSFMR